MVDLAKITQPLSLDRFGPRRTGPLVLELDLTEGVADEAPGDPIGQLFNRRRQHYLDVVEGIRRGARDPEVAALLVRVDTRSLGFAKIQELRTCVADFRSTGRPAVAWADSFGETGDGNLPYYLACAFSEIVMAPTGLLGLTGLMIKSTFVKGALDRLGLDYEVGKRHEYKNALNGVTETGFTDAHREATDRIVTSLGDQIVEGIAEARTLSEERVRALVSQGPFLAAEALEHGLVDRLAYRDEIYSDLLARARGDADTEPRLQFVTRYHRKHTPAQRPRPVGAADHIALITATGTISLGRTRRSPLGGGTVMGSDTVAAAFRAARRDPHVKAVVFRVDSRGGSPTASDAIRRESQLTREAGIPVVTTMGDFAGSGGYYVTLGSDAIVAQPGTLTGSIGVIVGKPVLGPLLERYGITSETVGTGEHAGMFGSDRAFTESEWERVNALLDQVYDDFTAKVGAARNMTRDQVHEVARGRVWTGRDARERGLVDALGGLETAVRIAREKVGGRALPLRPFPRQHPLDRLRQHESSEDPAAAQPQSSLSAWGPLRHVAAVLGLPEGGPLTMPDPGRLR
ncbi:signal peptide peptidase SppA [Nocardiopsis sp. N85]|uniref:signal peptide peptidase SppA n=1 Tax=Nocardiopsis sp. N85 TaxID=3029400 RepID=UPI00237F5E5B|nr:signal peptide peptidase SppA [Nocardiopsis sp. N85]MDE3719770.1 signal peptide peptidase SppA [Nocardiopsis sp. N85]